MEAQFGCPSCSAGDRRARFDFMNGFHERERIATVVSTRVLKPYQAVLLAAAFNFVALSPLERRGTIGKGCRPGDVEPLPILGRTGAIAGTSSPGVRIPSSSSHALIAPRRARGRQAGHWRS